MKDIKIIELMDLFDGEEEITTADKIDKPQKTLDRDMFKDFEERNPKMDGGMLVQPSDDGSRPGYKESKYKQITELSDFKKMQMGNKKMKDFKYEVQLPNKDGTLYTDYFKNKKDAKEAIKNSIILEKDFREGLAKRDKKDLPPGQKKLDKYRTITPTEEYAGYGKNKARIFKVENPNSGSVRYTIEGVGGKKQPLFKTLEEAREAKIADTPDEFVRTKKTPFRPANNVVAKEYINYKTGETKIKYKPTITLKDGKKATGGDSQGFNSLQEAEIGFLIIVKKTL